jgi:chloramphenicol-sensitive protein RarD
MNKGVLYAAGAYICWGLLPLYWKALQHVPALEILAHRMVWSLLVVFLLLAYQRHWEWLSGIWRDKRVLLTFITSALLLSINWFVYIWAVNKNYVVESSLGYFINPLVNVLLGFLFLRERLRMWQGVAIFLALSGVLFLSITYGAPPWIALTLAGSFGLYGLLRKTARLNSLEGLTLETILLFVPALSYLLYREASGSGALGHTNAQTTLLLVGSGVATAIPLLLFASGARMVSLTTLGILQYIAPTLQFLIGIVVYHEALTGERLIGFSLIWLALAVYTMESIVTGRRTTRITVATGKL